MAVAVPVLTPVSIKDLSSVSLASQNAVVIDYYGDGSKSGTAHYAMDDYIKDHNYTRTVPVIEEYVTDPLKDKDQKKWLTKIYYYTTEKNK